MWVKEWGRLISHFSIIVAYKCVSMGGKVGSFCTALISNFRSDEGNFISFGQILIARNDRSRREKSVKFETSTKRKSLILTGSWSTVNIQLETKQQ